jgi:hypothetical protein
MSRPGQTGNPQPGTDTFSNPAFSGSQSSGLPIIPPDTVVNVSGEWRFGPGKLYTTSRPTDTCTVTPKPGTNYYFDTWSGKQYERVLCNDVPGWVLRENMEASTGQAVFSNNAVPTQQPVIPQKNAETGNIYAGWTFCGVGNALALPESVKDFGQTRNNIGVLDWNTMGSGPAVTSNYLDLNKFSSFSEFKNAFASGGSKYYLYGRTPADCQLK